MRHEWSAVQASSQGRQPHIRRQESEPHPTSGVTRRQARRTSTPARVQARSRQNWGPARRTR
eukprot:14386979-Alexandrium_andersonii.AAC.1